MANINSTTQLAQQSNTVLSSFNNNPFKLSNTSAKQQSTVQSKTSSSSLIEDKSLSNYTTTVLAARAAAIAAAQSVNQQIMKQINSTTVDTSMSISSPPSQPSPPFAKAKDEAQINAEKEAEQKRLEEEMRKRRERIEKWRNEKKNKEAKDSQPHPQQPTHDANKQNGNNKGWNLEDDDDDEEAPNTNGKAKPVDDKQNYMDLKQSIEEPVPVKKEVKEVLEEEDEEDPLEAYMKEINKKAPKVIVEAKKKVETVIAVKSEKSLPKLVGQNNDDENLKSKKVTIMMGVAKASTEAKEKGQIMEQDIDGLEYDSDEEPSGALSDDLLLDGAPKLKTKSEMVFTDHSKVYYRPFTKNFYVEVPEISKMTNEEVEAYREELEGIKINGKNCPKPIKTWAQCGVSLKVMECLKKNAFEKPTPIQAQSLPIIMSGRDLIAIAKTGSGKTLAFLLPMFRHILDQPPLEIDDGPIAIIMTPTRELAMQIAKECKKFTKSLNISVVAVYGGTNISEQIAELKRGAEIIVCTPGRMIDMLAANNGRVTNLRRVTYVVLDEADRM